ncbi:MAG: tetratricopeptide repeat protein, partial [Desulfobacterales bacterium]|nr:tetratricopeptide repeat protein [Desulfobacterales bacterium]
ALNPDFAEGHNNLGTLFWCLGRVDDAISSLKKAVTIQPDYAGAHNNLGLAYLSVGNFQKGLPEHEWRWLADELPYTPRPCTQPLWDGSCLKDKTILVWGEQGVGDKIMLSRFLPGLAEQSKRCIVECEARLMPIFQRSYPTVEVVERTQPLDPSLFSSEIDFHIAMGGLMQWFISYENGQAVIPSTPGYIAANNERVEGFRRKYCDSEARLLVGVSWFSGNPYVGKYR